MSIRRATLMLVSVACLVGQGYAIDGVGVYCYWHYPFIHNQAFDADANYLRGPIIACTIQNNQVTARDTIFKDVGQYPALSPDGRRVAFFRWGVRLDYDGSRWTLVDGTRDDQCYLSVINIDGTGLTNLIPVDPPCASVGGNPDSYDGDAVLDWPAVDGGSWVYYEKPTKTGEIWRINADNPTQNEHVTTYNGGSFLRRWDLSLSADWSGSQSRGASVGWSGVSGFPLSGNDYFSSDDVGLVGCNPAVSASGNIVAHYYGGNHTALCIETWNHFNGKVPYYSTHNGLWAYNLHTVEDIEQWIGQDLFMDGKGGADLIRFSVNSDKWVMRMLGWCWQGNDGTGSNCVAVNWKDSEAIRLSMNPKPTHCGQPVEVVAGLHSKCADAGDLWIDFGPGNEDKWEDEYGVLRPYSEAGIYLHPASDCDVPSDCPDVPTMVSAPRVSSGEPSAVRVSGNLLALGASNHYHVRIVDAHGRVVRSTNGSGPDVVDMGSLSAGVYQVRATVDGKSYSVSHIKTR